jgi:hypothetical protein
VLFAGLVSGALLTSGLVEVYFSYKENQAALVAIQREKALGAATRIEQFIKEIERQAAGRRTAPQELLDPLAQRDHRPALSEKIA